MDIPASPVPAGFTEDDRPPAAWLCWCCWLETCESCSQCGSNEGACGCPPAAGAGHTEGPDPEERRGGAFVVQDAEGVR